MVHWDLRTQCRCAGLVVPGGSAPGATDHQGTRAVSKEAPEEAPSCGSLTATQRRSPGALAGGQLLLHEPLCGPAWRRGGGPAGAGASAEGRGRQVLVLCFLQTPDYVHPKLSLSDSHPEPSLTISLLQTGFFLSPQDPGHHSALAPTILFKNLSTM